MAFNEVLKRNFIENILNLRKTKQGKIVSWDAVYKRNLTLATMNKLFAALLFFTALSTAVSAQVIPSFTAEQLMKRATGSDTVYVMNFWATWCAPCIAELPAFESTTENYAGKKVKVLLVSMDFPEDYPTKIQAFANRKKIKSEVVWLKETDANLFIPKIDGRWTGALPATVIMNGKSGNKLFFEKQMSADELSDAIQKFQKG